MKAPIISTVLSILFFSVNIRAADEATVQSDNEWLDADRALNAAYQALLPSLTATDAASLKKAQTAWLVYRDAQAALKAHLTSDGGSAYSTDFLANSTELTIERTKQLKALLKLAKGTQ